MRFRGIKNIQKKIKQKVVSILIIVILICSGLFIIIPSNSNFSMAIDMPSSTEKIDNEFYNGTLNNVEIINQGNNSVLRLNSSILNSNDWTEKKLNVKPSLRHGHAMATIWGTDKVLLYGGANFTSGFTLYKDTWIYDYSENNWTDMSPLGNPGKTYYHTMASIYGTDKVLIFRTYNSFLKNTWVYTLSNNSWTEKASLPFNRTQNRVAMAPVFGTDKVVLFGSIGNLNETWIFDLSNNTWTNKTPKDPTKSPVARCDHAMASIYGTDKVILFGGYAFNDDTNIYDLSEDNWQLMSPTGTPATRFYQVMEAIQGTDKIMLFGGTASGNNNLAETWIYDVSDNTWLKMTISNFPRPRSLHAMATIDGTDMILLFGGYDGMLKDDTWVFKYYLPELEGTYISEPHDTHANSSFNQLTWVADIPVNTSIKIQLRSANNLTNLNARSFVGPDGNTTTLYNSTTTDIWFGHDGDRYIQYKVYFNVMDFTQLTPSLKDVTITYNCLPSVKIINPPDNAVVTDNKPNFIWTFIDYDSAKQTVFQVLIDDDREFTDVMFDSGEQISNEEYWEFPIGTGYSELPDGRWFWKLRARGEDGVWTEFNTPRRLTVDTNIPSSSPVIPDNNGFYYDLNSVLGVATDSEPSSGLKQIEITIKNLNSNEYWDGSSWVAFKIWLPTIGTLNWTYDSNQIQWTSGVQYSIQSRAIDNASNIEEPRDEIIFTIDTESPISSINEPQDDVWVNKLTTISGSSLDNGGSGVDRIEICIKCINDNNKIDTINEENKYWNGNAWDTNECWLLTKETILWGYNFTRIPWNTCNNYLIRSRAVDGIDNQEQPGPGINFTYDDIAPEPIAIKIHASSVKPTIPP